MKAEDVEINLFISQDRTVVGMIFNSPDDSPIDNKTLVDILNRHVEVLTRVESELN